MVLLLLLLPLPHALPPVALRLLALRQLVAGSLSSWLGASASCLVTAAPKGGLLPAACRGRTVSALQMMVPSGMSPIGFTLPMVSAAFLPA